MNLRKFLNNNYFIPSTVFSIMPDEKFEEHPYFLYEQYKNALIGTIITMDVAAPGVGKISYQIEKITKDGIYTKRVDSSVRILSPDETK